MWSFTIKTTRVVYDLASSLLSGFLNGVNKLLDAKLALAASVVHVADLAKNRTLAPALHMYSLGLREAGTEMSQCSACKPICRQCCQHAPDSTFLVLGYEAPS